MSTSAIGSSNPYSYLQWPSQSGVDSTDNSGPPSDPLIDLYNAATGGASSSDPLVASLNDDPDGSSAPVAPFSPETMSALFSMQGQTPTGDPGPSSASQSVFGQFDANNDGQISQSEFEQAIGPDADQSKVDELFNVLDGNGDGSISQDEMSSAMQKAHGGHHHHHHAGGAGQAGQAGDPLSQILSGTTQQADGTTSQSVTNADGSTTTTITYADGTKIDMTTPATTADGSQSGGVQSGSPSGSSSPSSLQMMLQRMIAMQAQMFAPSSSMSMTV